MFRQKVKIVEVKKETTKEDVMSFLKKNPLTELELLNMLTEHARDINGDFIDRDVEKKMFDAVSKVDGMPEYLRITMNKDIQRYFMATSPQEQLMAKGAYSRTAYWKGLTIKKEVTTPAKLPVKRYAK